MGKKGTKRKTRWRVLPIGGDDGGVCSGNEDDGDMDRDSASPNGSYARAANNSQQQQQQQQHRLLRGKGRPPHHHSRNRPYYQQHDNGQPLVAAEKKTFNEEEYTKITTPRQDVLFKKGYLGRKRPTPAAPDTTAPSAAPADVTNGNLRPDGSIVQNGEPLDNDQGYEVIAPDEQPQIIYTNGYVDQSGIYYINGGYELYDPYSGGVTVVVGPAPHFPAPGGGPPVLAAVPCQPLPLQPLEWFNPAFVPYVPAPPMHDPAKRFSIDSQNCSPQSSESTGPPGSPQECEDGSEHLVPTYQPQGHPVPPPAYVYPGYMFGPPVYNMNGVTVQGAPPQPSPGDSTAASKRRKKKRRRRRRRGGAEDGSEESSSEEKELEEPMSITSQESSSQELESDSKQSPTAEHDAVLLSPQDANVLPLQADQEKTIFVCSTENTDIKPVALQQGPIETDCERLECRIGSGDIPVVNGILYSDSSDISCKGEALKNVSKLPPQPPTPTPTPLPLPQTPPPTPAATAQESLPDIEINGYSSDAVPERFVSKTKTLERDPAESLSTSHIETLNNAANKIKSGKPLQDHKKKWETKKSNSKSACNGNVNVKQSGSKLHKESRQHNLQNGYLPNLTSKMDGNENLSRSSDQVEKTPRTKVAGPYGNRPNSVRQEPISRDCTADTSKAEEYTQKSCSPSVESAPSSPHMIQTDRTEKNKPPNKPVRKDLCKTTKSSSTSATLPSHPDLSQSIQTANVAEYLVDAIAADNLVTKNGDDVAQIDFPCSSTVKLPHIVENMYITSIQDESKETSGCPVKEFGAKRTSESKGIGFGESSSIVDVEGKNMPTAHLDHFTGMMNVSSTEDEREAEPPPIPPPRKKRWKTSIRRQSLERAPTPGRELEASILESVSDESSLSSSTQSEESVIELLSSMPTSPDAEAKPRSSEDDDLIFVGKPLEKFESPETLQPVFVTGEKSSMAQMSAVEIETFADVLSHTIILEAVEDTALECSKYTRPITHAVTRWLRSQSPEEVLSLPSCEHSESEIDDSDISGESTEDMANVRQEIQTGPKNVHRNPLPASSLKISCKLKNFNNVDGAGRRVAKKSGYQIKLEKKTVKNATKEKTNVLEEFKQIYCDAKLTKGSEQSKLLPKNFTSTERKENVHCTENMSKVQMHVVGDESFSSDSSECQGEWDAWDCQSVKPSTLTMTSNKTEEMSLPTESPEDRRTAMCDPTLSVAKYYSLGAAVKNAVRQQENSDTMSESGSEEEVDALHHFRSEMEDTRLQHPTLASELACSYEPLPKHWAVDPVTVISGKLGDSTFKKKYLPDSGVQSEESGDEVTIGSNAQRINLKANLLHHHSAILMSHLEGDGPFHCGGICCILQ